MKRIVIGTALAILFGCGGGDSFRNGFPTSETVAVNFPASSSGELRSTGSLEQPLLNQRSDFYTFTRGATVMFNGAAYFVLTLVKSITDHNPTSVKDNTAVWGPHTEALSPITWRFEVTRNGDHNYSYALSGKAKEDGDDAYQVILSGTHTVAEEKGEELRGFGNGTFLVDFDRRRLLPEYKLDEMGTIEFTYSRMSPTSDVNVAAKFRQVYDKDTAGRLDADYGYVSTASQGGEFEFSIMKNIHDLAQPQIEKLSIHSRWQEDGAGRADIRVNGGELSAPATGSDCWNPSFASVYFTATYGAAGYGSEAACAFTPAKYAN